MYGFLLAILILDGIFLSVVILLQAGKGGGLAAVGGGGGTMTEGVLGGRQATTVLTRATWTSGALFMLLSLWLSILSSRSAAPESVIQVPAPTTTQPEPVLPGLGGEPAPGGAAPAQPSGPPGTPPGAGN
ncbi:MAG TPA: preprotein translocase subunit SecG [Candidatus Limnocylindrales bacterium]|nr:preprotein translocase subunit SecG [Candidatus Limnocylindrales bacterium]